MQVFFLHLLLVTKRFHLIFIFIFKYVEVCFNLSFEPVQGRSVSVTRIQTHAAVVCSPWRYRIDLKNLKQISKVLQFLTESSVAACIPQRYVLGIMGLLGMANAYIMRACLSIAITAMVTHRPPDSTYVNEEECPAVDQGNSTVRGVMVEVSVCCLSNLENPSIKGYRHLPMFIFNW